MRLAPDRRSMLLGLASALPGSRLLAQTDRFVVPPLAPLKMDVSRIIKTTVCLRPFRAAGPRLDVEKVGSKRVVHNYGHGGSGWSLSWGSAEVAAGLALAGGARKVAVIGCGAIGLTTALTLQRAGAQVTIYAADRTPYTRSVRATGTWSPDSRIADQDRIDAAFPALWDRMARRSYATWQTLLGRPGDPVSWSDRYGLADPIADPPAIAFPTRPPAGPEVRFFSARLPGLAPRGHELQPD